MLENLSPKVPAAGLTLEHVLCPPDRYAGSQPRGPCHASDCQVAGYETLNIYLLLADFPTLGLTPLARVLIQTVNTRTQRLAGLRTS
jgi:hypothetical protein